MAKVRRDQVSDDCWDDENEDELKIVSGDDSYGGMGPTLTGVVIAGDEGRFTDAALHGRTEYEEGIDFDAAGPDEVPGGRTVYVVWVLVAPDRQGGYHYKGVCACSMVVDADSGTGYKDLMRHAEMMQKAMGGGFDLSLIDVRARETLRRVLEEKNGDTWERSSDELKEALVATTAGESAGESPALAAKD